jgi:hypothetical protein
MIGRFSFVRVFTILLIALCIALVLSIVIWTIRKAKPVALPPYPVSTEEYRDLATAYARKDGVPVRKQSATNRTFALNNLLLDKAVDFVGKSKADIISAFGEPTEVKDGSFLKYLHKTPIRKIKQRDVAFSYPGLRDNLWTYRYDSSLSYQDLRKIITYDVLEEERAKYTSNPPSDIPWKSASSLVYSTGALLNERQDYCFALVIELDDDNLVIRYYSVWIIKGLY